MYVAERTFKNEEKIKAAIVDAHARGVCDRNGGHIPKEKRGAAGKGDRMRHVDKDRFDKNYVRIFGHE
jgi:hypothetical protein